MSFYSLVNSQASAPSSPQGSSALVYIHRHLNKPFGAAETAEAVGLPRSTLDHLFAEKVGHSIGQEILNQRIRRAKHLLKDNHTQLKAIAGICGFCNASYFTNTFKRETGLSPKDWRHQMTANATYHH